MIEEPSVKVLRRGAAESKRTSKIFIVLIVLGALFFLCRFFGAEENDQEESRQATSSEEVRGADGLFPISVPSFPK